MSRVLVALLLALGLLPATLHAAPTPTSGGVEAQPHLARSYFGARHHMSATGRFTTVDPVMNVEAAMTDPQRWNRYSYALNSPMKFVDPDGRDPRLAWLLNVAQRAAVSAGQRAQQVYVWATRFFNSPTGQEITQTAAEAAAGYDGPSVTGSVGRLGRAEFETGTRLAQQLGQTIRVSDHVGAEFISAAGKTFDAMGTPQAFANWNSRQFMDSIDRHLLKSVDFTVIDLTGANARQIGAIRTHVGGYRRNSRTKSSS